MSFIFWANTANYPAGGNSWSATPTKVNPNYTYVTPGVPVSAQEINFLLNGIALEAAQSTAVGPANWGAIVSSTTVLGGGYSFGAAAYDGPNDLWSIAGSNGTNTVVSYTINNGISWNAFVTIGAFFNVASMATDGVHTFLTYVKAGGINGGGGENTSITNATGANSNALLVYTPTPEFATLFWYASASLFVTVMSANNSTTTAHGYAMSSPTALALTDRTSALPAVWQASTNHIGALFNAIGPTDMLVSAAGVTPSTDTSRIMHVTFPGSVLTFTDLSLPAGISTGAITGLAYNQAQGQWGVLSTNLAGNSLFYTTSDLVTWTLQNTFTGTTNGLASQGPYWITSQSFVYNGATFFRTLISIDGINRSRNSGNTFTSQTIALIGSNPDNDSTLAFSTAGVQLSTRTG
jgi:hypothetical protein